MGKEDIFANAPKTIIDQTMHWEKQLATTPSKNIESILNQKVVKKTKGNEYLQYLVKQKNQPVEDATWMKTTYISKYGNISVEELMDNKIP